MTINAVNTFTTSSIINSEKNPEITYFNETQYRLAQYKLNYRACIPLYVLLDKRLSANELRLYGLIEQMQTSLSDVFITNKGLSYILGINNDSKNLQKMAQKLKRLNYIRREQKGVYLNGRIQSLDCWSIVHNGNILIENNLSTGGGTEQPPEFENYTGGVAEQPPGGVAEQPPGGVAEQPPLNNNIINALDIKKTNRSVTVFSDPESVKNHLNEIVATRGTFVEEETLEQGVYYAYETNQDKSFDTVHKRLNIFLKKVREGQWLIPQGFKGITSQSIRVKEESQRLEKQNKYQQDSFIFKNLVTLVSEDKGKEQGQGLKDFHVFFQQMKKEIVYR